MAGQQKKHRIRNALLRRARAELGDDMPEREADAIAEYCALRLAGGTTMVKLTAEVGEELGELVHRQQVERLVEESERATELLSRARARGAHALAEDAVQLLDDAVESREALMKAKSQADARQWLAERWNRSEFGQQKGPTVSISIGRLHLDALRQRARVPNGFAHALPSVTGEEVEIHVSADEATS